MNALVARPGGEHEEPERDARPADDGHALDAVGEPPHRHRAEHEERRRRRRDEDDRALADPERPLDLRPEHVDRGALELVEREQQPEHDEHELAADLERVGERDRLGVDAREQVVGEDDLLAGALVRVFAGVLLLEDRRTRATPRSPRRLACVSVTQFPPTGTPVDDRLRDRIGFPADLRQLTAGYCRDVGFDRNARGRALPRARVGDRRRRAGSHGRAAHARGSTRSPHFRDGERAVLQHFERTDSGPSCVGASTSSQVHAGLQTLLCTGPLVDLASALLGEPAVLYKEKINYKLPGGAGYSAHQDAPAYPMIDVHVSAMVAVDDADATTAASKSCRGASTSVLPLDERGASIRRSSTRSSGSRCRCGRSARCGSTAVPRTAAAPTARIGPAAASTPPTTPHAKATSAPSTTRRSAACSRAHPSRRPRAGLAHRRLRRSTGMKVVFTVLDALPVRHVGDDHTPVLATLARSAGGAPAQARSVMTSSTYPNHATFVTGAHPRDHGIVTNWVPETGRLVPAWKLRPDGAHAVRRVPCRRASPARRSSVISIWSGVMGAPRPTRTGRPTACLRPRPAPRREGLRRRPRHRRRDGRRARRPSRPRRLPAQRTRHRGPRPRARQRGGARVLPRHGRAARGGARTSRLGRHGVDHRVRSRSRDTRRPRADRPAGRDRAARG